jgi:hypothetical protein
MMKKYLPRHAASRIIEFTGRTWLLPVLLNWLEHSDERVFLLTGEPGSGKTMIAAWLAGHSPAPANPAARDQLEAIRDKIAAVHFCMAASRNNSPLAFAESVASQLTRNVPGFGDSLNSALMNRVQLTICQALGTPDAAGITGITIIRLDLSNMGDERSFDLAIVEPIKSLYASGFDKPLVIAVDALDEALTYTGQISIVQLLSRLDDLPRKVRILATNRLDPRVLKYFRNARCFDLINDAPLEADDVRLFIHKQLATHADNMDALQREQLSERIIEAAQGNFLFGLMALEYFLTQSPNVPGFH